MTRRITVKSALSFYAEMMKWTAVWHGRSDLYDVLVNVESKEIMTAEHAKG